MHYIILKIAAGKHNTTNKGQLEPATKTDRNPH